LTAARARGGLLTLVYDRAEHASDFCILDAQHPDHGPVAEIPTAPAGTARVPRHVDSGVARKPQMDTEGHR
jgi:carotenoid cleavage dioxygenase-like enzyme